jgi:hypothetical protein
MPNANRSNVYRTLVCLGINRVPQEKNHQASTFKEYEPGYLHIDVTYLPKLAGVSYILLFVVEKKLICYGNYPPNLGGSLRV